MSVFVAPVRLMLMSFCLGMAYFAALATLFELDVVQTPLKGLRRLEHGQCIASRRFFFLFGSMLNVSANIDLVLAKFTKLNEARVAKSSHVF